MKMELPDKFAEVATVTVAGALGWVWNHLTRRLTRLEESLLARDVFDRHVDQQNGKFETLFNRQEKISDNLSEVHSAVARIEGTLMTRRREDRDAN